MAKQEIRFYELSKVKIEQALPQLLYKIYDSLPENILLLVEDQKQAISYDQLLWTFSSNKFLPHGKATDEKNIYHPLLITDKEENLNQAQIIVTNCVVSNDFIKQFTKQIMIFPESQKDIFLEKLSSLEYPSDVVTYWKQDQSGKWYKN